MTSSFIFFFMLSVIAVEAATELLVKSVIFRKFREWIGEKHKAYEKLISCGYCTSVWVALPPSLWLSYCQEGFCQEGFSPLIQFFIILLSIHRLSNYLHNFNDKWLDKFYDKSKDPFPQE